MAWLWWRWQEGCETKFQNLLLLVVSLTKVPLRGLQGREARVDLMLVKRNYVEIKLERI